MILYLENFDQVKTIEDLKEIYKWETIGTGEICKEIDGYSLGEHGSQFLHSNTGIFGFPIVKPSRKFVFGIMIWSPATPEWTSMPYLRVRCRHNNTNLFEIEGQITNGSYGVDYGYIAFNFNNYDVNTIAPTPEVRLPFNRFRKNLLEFYIDSTGSENNEGTLKIAINGLTIVEQTNVCLSNVAYWDSDPNNEASRFNNIQLRTGDPVGPYGSNTLEDVCIDSLYICNEDGGYHDDFLGMYEITTFYPGMNGDINNWNGFPDGVDNAFLVSTPEIAGTEADDTYIEADAESVIDLYYMSNTIEYEQNMINNPIAVNFRTCVKNMFDYNDMEFDKGLVALTKPSGNIISREYSGKIDIDQYSYKLLDCYYGIVPNLATPWTWEFLDGTQFGMETVGIRKHIRATDGFGIEDALTEEYYNYGNYPKVDVAPEITGTFEVGEDLTCSEGTWLNSPDSYAYQWLKNDVYITGATSSTYTLVTGDTVSAISCIVTATNSYGSMPFRQERVADYTAKSFVLDIAGNWGNTDHLGIRAIQFYLAGELIAVETANIEAYATTIYHSTYNPPAKTFITNNSLIGDDDYNEWISAIGSPTNQRLICVFSSAITFDSVVVHNYHDSGIRTTIGVTDVKINITPNEITDTTYNASIPNSQLIFDGQFRQHIASNVEDPEVIFTNPKPKVSILPEITGEFESGEVLTCSQGTWDNSPSAYAYQWVRNNNNIPGETTTTYTLLESDLDDVIRCVVTAYNGFGSGSYAVNGNLLQAKSFVLDIATGWGGSHFGMRQIDFLRRGEKIELTPSDYSTYGLDNGHGYGYHLDYIWDTTTSKIGDCHDHNSWLGVGRTSNTRLICVFHIPIIFDDIVVTNHHSNGGGTTDGIRAVTIHISSDEITDDTFDAVVPNSEMIYLGDFLQHTTNNTEDPQSLLG